MNKSAKRITIEYDEVKNIRIIKELKISVPEVATIFDNPFTAPTADVPVVMHSSTEQRYHAYGWTTTGFYVKIWYTYRNGNVRIIGGRKLK